jgi:acetamidase/formamidase
MALGVRVKRLRTGPWGWNKTNPVAALGIEGEPHWQLWSLDPDELIGRDQAGRVVELRPFMGVMGLPPDEPGEHSTGPPRPCGGNIDCKELVVGSTLYLPVTVAGALFSTGDGHAAQGDGEVSGTAIECGMDVCELEFSLHPEMRLRTPRADTPAGWLSLGFGEDLDEAGNDALGDMLDLLGERFQIERKEALALASVAVDLRVTQVVNGVFGVHALLPHGAIREA